MEYISVEKASERWGVSLRQVQRLLAHNRIPRAKKLGKSWLIPYDAEKPIDSRREKKLPEKSLTAELSYVIASTALPMPQHNPDAILDVIIEERLKLQYECELSFLRGDFEQTLRCFRETEGDDASRLRASYLAIAASISLADFNAYAEIESYLKGCIDTNIDRDIIAVAELALAAAAVSALAPNMAPSWLKGGDFSALPPEARPNALYLRAKYFQCTGNFEAMLAVAQTALSLSESQQGVTLTDIYLRMLCSVACYYLARRDEAKYWLLEAMDIALPHGFITPFAENITALGGLIERCLKEAFPNSYAAILGQCERTFKNWIAFHNQFTKDNVTHILSLREYHIALLVGHRVPYKDIADQYGISVGRLKNIMLEVYGKLFISGRDELAKYIF